MRANAAPSPARNGKRRLLESCAIAAGIMALAYGGPAMAQAAGTGTFTTGTGTFDVNGTTKTTTVSVGGTNTQNIINWVPTDNLATGGDINFLPADSTLSFNGNGSYIVLNRFVDSAGGSLSRQIALNGTVNSTNNFTSGGQGGSIWFYNAGGILIGSTGVINVGSLVLTTNDIVATGPGGLIDPTTGIRFRAETPGSTAAVTVSSGARISAVETFASGSSYVALVAPRIVQSGRVSVDGSAAYVAADSADIRINAGLFDINVLSGAAGGQAITHTGTTTGPEQSATGPAQRIYMVAVAKNDAVSMLVSGQVGFQDAATTARTDSQGRIILSAGYNVVGGAIGTTPVGAAADITVNDIIFRSDVTAHASGAFLGKPLLDIPPPPPPSSVQPPSPAGTLVVQGNALFIGDSSATLTIDAGRIGNIGGDLTVQAGGTATNPGTAAVNVNGGGLLVQGRTSIFAPGFFGTAAGDTQGGNASLSITGGGQFVGTGVIEVSADAFGGVDGTGLANGDGRGGTATITVSGASATGTASRLSGDNIYAHANGYGAFPSSGFDNANTGGAGFGGTATISIQNGADLSATGGLTAEANGFGGFGLIQAGDGTGGNALVEVTGTGTTLQAASTTVSAKGTGGGDFSFDPVTGSTLPVLNGGDGIGGTATLRFNTGGTSGINAGDTLVDASGFGGSAGQLFVPSGENATGGNGTGGTATIETLGGTSATMASLTVNATGASGEAFSDVGTSARSGDGTGGTIDLSVTGTGSALALTGGNIQLNAGGSAAANRQQNAGSGTGGRISVSATGGGTIRDVAILSADAFGGSSSLSSPINAGSGTGGTIDILADTGGTISAQGYDARANASVVNTSGNNGAAQGGNVSMIARGGGSIVATSDGFTTLQASAVDGVSADGSAATGGNIRMIADGGSILLIGTSLDASATSGSTDFGSPSLATGGTIAIQVGADPASQISVDFLDATANATAGADFDGFSETPGDAQGGTVTVDVQGGSLTTSVSTTGLSLTANGNGGTDGEGRGGSVTFTQTGGNVDVGNVTIGADGRGGQSGAGFGGTARLSLSSGSFNGGSVLVTASGVGGEGVEGNDDPDFGQDGGVGGAGQGGTATIDIGGTAIVDTSILSANARGTGGQGGNFFSEALADGLGGTGGTGTGGTATVNLTGGNLNTVTAVADAGGVGGNGGDIFTSFSGGPSIGLGVGGNGGDGFGGTATINLGATTLTLGEGAMSIRSIASGGNGGYGSDGGNGGSAVGGLAQAIVDNRNAGSLAVILDSTATGGNGGTGGNGNGGNGGDGQGGGSRIEATGANAAVFVAQANFRTGGTGGAGGSAFTDFSSAPAVGGRGGNGGEGQGGSIEVAANNGATVTLNAGPFGSVANFSSTGTGGNGGRGADTDAAGAIGGGGGNGGAGVGGTVYLSANGGTITSSTVPLTITVNGVSGAAGDGGIGAGGNGAAGSAAIDRGGLVLFEALAGTGGPGQINLADTAIQANGGLAGRIEMRTGGVISMNSLTAEALGAATPTNNNTDVAGAGIFFAANGGSITTTGDMTLRTGSSVGAYAQAGGQVRSGGNMTIEAGDQVDLRHDNRGEAVNPSLFASGDLSISAGTGISGAPGTLISAGNTLVLQTTTANGNISVDRLAGNDIVVTTAGFANIEHAEAVDDFTANVGRFRTGPNSLITGGDISVTAAGTIDLGNATAGGSVYAAGQSIAFDTVNAGTFISFFALGTGATDGVFGNNLTAQANGISMIAPRVGVTGTVQAGGGLRVTGTAGDVAFGLADVAGEVSIFARNNLSGVYHAGGYVNLVARGNVTVEADAAGSYVPPSGGPAFEGYVFVDAGGDAILTNSSAATMLGVHAGGAVSLTGATAGEDVFVLAGTGATLSNISAGDDLTVEAPGTISVTNAVTTGTGPDGRSVVYAPSAVSPGLFLQTVTTPADLSNITLTAGADISANNVTAFDRLTANATGAITGSSIGAGGLISLSGASIGVGSVRGGNSLSAVATVGGVAIADAVVDGNIGVFSQGNLTGSYRAGGDISLSSAANINASVNAAGGFVDPSNGDILTAGNAFVDAAGSVTLSNSSAASMFGVNGQSVSLTNASAGEDMLVLSQSTANLSGITVGDDLDVRAPGAITANGVNATGQGPDGFLLFYSSSSGFTIGQGEGSSSLDGSDINLQSSGASINASGLSAGDDILLTAATTIALNGGTTLGLGITGGDSSIRTTGGDTTLSGLNAFSDVVVAANGTANVTGAVRAGNDVIINANAVTLADIPSSGAPIDTIVAGRDIAITSAADISGGGALTAGRNLTLTAGGLIDITKAESGDGGEMTLTGIAGIDADQLYSRGATALNADNGDIRVGTMGSLGDVSVAANSLNIGTSGPITFANIVTDVGDATIGSNNLLIVNNATVAGTARFSNSGEHMIIRNLTANAAEFNANEMLSMTSVSVTNALTADAGTTIAIDGVVTGRDISLASADIAITSTGRVGTAGRTQSLTLENNDDEQQTFVGGTGTKNGYHVDTDELTRLFGTDIEIFAPEVNAAVNTSVGSSAPPDLIVDSFTMTGGAAGSNLGANGSLTIRTPGKMRVIGNAQLTGLTDDNALNLRADEALEVILGQGTVRLLGANNAPGGDLNMRSSDIIVATQAAITDVGNATTTDAINTRLAKNDGVTLDEGALFARGIRFDVSGGVYVQNSGTGTDFGQRRGLTFGAGGLSVLSGGTPRIVINGVQLGPNGQVTGLDTIPLLTVTSATGAPGSFDPRSTFNGCLIANTGSCTAVSFDPGGLFPVQDVIEEEADSDGDNGDGTSLPAALITMRDLDPLSGEPLLDDPVTGAGNDDLWTPTTDSQQP